MGVPQDYSTDAGHCRIKAERIPHINAGGCAEVVVAGKAVGLGGEGLIGDARDYALGHPRRAGEDIRVGSDEVGLVLHVEAGLAPAAEL